VSFYIRFNRIYISLKIL